LVSAHYSCIHDRGSHWPRQAGSDLLNHKATENFEKQTDDLKSVIQQGNAELKGVIAGGNKALVTAIKELE
jgi:hypothetical protein